jgi:acetyl-CoA carboxylase, biotin carboxylase subunit
MIGKLLVWAESRDEAIVRMLGALEDFEIGGIETNLELHKFIMNHADYKNERVNTRWLESVLLPGFQGSLARTAG